MSQHYFMDSLCSSIQPYIILLSLSLSQVHIYSPASCSEHSYRNALKWNTTTRYIYSQSSCPITHKHDTIRSLQEVEEPLHTFFTSLQQVSIVAAVNVNCVTLQNTVKRSTWLQSKECTANQISRDLFLSIKARYFPKNYPPVGICNGDTGNVKQSFVT